MTTQLIIDGTEAVLPQNFATTVKRENSFFTKSGEYTYDCTLNLDNPVNCQLYKFLQRLNSTEEITDRRSAVLIADGHVYCRGTEVITRWTEHTVTIQIVSGESELNYFIGQDRKIEDLDMGSIEGSMTGIDNTMSFPDVDYCLPTVRSASGVTYNEYSGHGSAMGGHYTGTDTAGSGIRPQPYLCALIRKILTALGYTIGTNQLEETQFRNLFIVNTVYTTEFAKMVPGWTVKDFLTEVEKLTGVVFITDNLQKTCDIVLKTAYYQEASQFTIRNVTDAYETEAEDDDSRIAEFSSSDVSFSLPDHYWAKLMKLPEGFLEQATVTDMESIADLLSISSDNKTVYHDTSTDRYYISMVREYEVVNPEPGTDADTYFMEVNQFCDLDREATTSKLELKITPAPMAQLGRFGVEVIDIGSSDGYRNYQSEEAATDTDENSDNVENLIRSFENTESSAGDLYCAFHNGTVYGDRCPVAYTDAYHATMQVMLYPMTGTGGDVISGPEGSLRLQDMDTSYFQGSYQIDTSKAYTFETYDPNVIDVRQVYVIRNRRFVCRDVEEVITSDGRQKRWKGTFYPIRLSDEALENRWVLTHGVWDDHAAWLDDGRWNDNYDGAPV